MVERRCAGRTFDGRVVRGWPCQETRKLTKRGKEYWCRHHDPVLIQQRRQRDDDEWKAKERAESSMARKGTRLARALGLRGSFAYVNYLRTPRQRKPMPWVVVSHVELEKLLKRLGNRARK